MLRTIGRIIFKIILLPIKLIVVLIEFALTAINAVILAAGSLVGKLTGIIAGLAMIAAVLDLLFGSHSMVGFGKFMLIGIVLSAVPAAIAAIGVEGITMLKKLLYNVLCL